MGLPLGEDGISRFAKIGSEMVSLGNIEEQARSVLEEDSEEDLAAAAVPDARKGEQVIMLVTSSELQHTDLGSESALTPS